MPIFKVLKTMKTIASAKFSAIYAHIKKIRKQSLWRAFPIVLPLIKATRAIQIPYIALKGHHRMAALIHCFTIIKNNKNNSPRPDYREKGDKRG